MAKAKNIEDLEERISGKKISEKVEILKRIVNLEKNLSFIMGYCGSDDETFYKIAEYIRTQVGISAKCVLETTIHPASSDLTNYIIKHKDELQNLPGGVIIIKIKGFEKLEGLDSESNFRIAHDYDQNVIEGFGQHHDLIEQIKGLTKKIIVLTQIGYSEGEKAYDLALTSAISSQFKSFIYELENEKENQCKC